MSRETKDKPNYKILMKKCMLKIILLGNLSDFFFLPNLFTEPLSLLPKVGQGGRKRVQ